MVTSTTRNRATFQNLPPKATNRSLSAFLKPSMTTLRYLCPASLLALLLCSCTATNPPRPDVAAPDLAWMFDGHIADGAPSFDVYLEVNGTPHMVVNNAETEYRELEPGEGNKWGIPANRLTACTSWWAGHGDVAYVVHEGGKLHIYRALLEEGTETTPFKRIKTISY